MAGLSKTAPWPTELRVFKEEGRLEVDFSDGHACALSAEYLRVESPSAEVQGHGPGQEVLQVGKRGVAITALEPVGHYALRPVFSDGHDSGLYSWDYLYQLGRDQDRLWADYESRLRASFAKPPAPPP